MKKENLEFICKTTANTLAKLLEIKESYVRVIASTGAKLNELLKDIAYQEQLLEDADREIGDEEVCDEDDDEDECPNGCRGSGCVYG
jgi:hypothetical protein